VADITDRVIADFERRRELGMQEYGKPLEPHDPNEDWIWNAYEESMDHTIYLRAAWEREQARKEREQCREEVQRGLSQVVPDSELPRT
jgi:hypothetical protein